MRCPQERFPIVCPHIEHLSWPFEIKRIRRDLEDLVDDALGIIVDDVVAENVPQVARFVFCRRGPDVPNDIGPSLHRGKQLAKLLSRRLGEVVLAVVRRDVCLGADVFDCHDCTADWNVTLDELATGRILWKERGRSAISTYQ